MKSDENHFNQLQQKTRAIASTWILAGFGAIAYFIKTSDPVLEYFSAYSMINLICLMVVIGLLILWIIDQLVYQQLLNANFVAGLFHEFKNQNTPPIRVLMIVGSEFKGMGKLYNLFYFIPMSAFTLFSTAAMLMEILISDADHTAKIQTTSIVVSVILAAMYVSVWIYIFSKKRNIPFYNLLKSFGDPEFLEINTPEKSSEVVRSWDPTVRQLLDRAGSDEDL